MSSNIEKIGQGNFGTVYKAHDQNGNPLAIKKVPMTIHEKQKQEIDKLKALKSDHIVKLLDINAEESEVQIVMEFCEKNLRQQMKEKNMKFTFEEILSFLVQTVSAFLTLESKNVIHKDLKPENILIKNKGVYKICDFGCSSIAQKSLISKARNDACFGTLEYVAPENYVSTKEQKLLQSSFDVWSFGCILHELIYGYLPFHLQKDPKGKQETVEQFSMGQIDLVLEPTKTKKDQFLQLLGKMLNRRSQDRPRFSSIKDYLINRFGVHPCNFMNLSVCFQNLILQANVMNGIVELVKNNQEINENTFWTSGKHLMLDFRVQLLLYIRNAVQEFTRALRYKFLPYYTSKIASLNQELNREISETSHRSHMLDRKLFRSLCNELMKNISPSNQEWNSVRVMQTFLTEILKVEQQSNNYFLIPKEHLKKSVRTLELQLDRQLYYKILSF